MDSLEFEKTYFEIHGEEMLSSAGISKVQFATIMGIAPQNVNKLLATKNVITLSKIATILNVPLQTIIYGREQQNKSIYGCIYYNGVPHLINKKEDLETILKFL